MITDTSFGYLKANTVLFAQKMCQSLNDMCGAQFMISKESLREGTFSTPYPVILFADFSGTIQGNYIISLDDTVAVNLINAGDAAASPGWASDIRSEYSGLLKEALNTAVGQAIEELGKSFCDLAYSPVTAVLSANIPALKCFLSACCITMQAASRRMVVTMTSPFVRPSPRGSASTASASS